jgi:adenosylcobinamide-GDP ribazoletransferase
MVKEYIIKPTVTAIRTLTVIPLPGADTHVFGRSLLSFPLAGVLIGLCCCGLVLIMDYCTFADPLLVSALIVLVSIVISGGMHLDGIADTADGFFGGRGNKERILEIMKDPRQGTFGVIAIVFDVILKILLLKSIVAEVKIMELMALFIVSRGVQPVMIAFFPYARAQNGIAAPFSQNSRAYAFISVILTAIIAISVMKFTGFKVVLISLCAIIVWSIYCVKKIGGVTGDCIGAGNEIVELALLVYFSSVS